MYKKKTSDFTDSITSSSSISAHLKNGKVVTSRFMSSPSLADHITNDRLRDKEHHKSTNSNTSSTSASSLTRQKSKNHVNSASSKENDGPSFAASLRNIVKFASSSPSTIISSPSSSSSSVKKQSSNDTLCIGPARLSLDENALYKKSLSSSRRNHQDYYSNVSNSVESEPGYFNSPSRTTTSRKLGREVPSKYMVMTTDAASFDESMLSTAKNKNTMLQKSSSIKRVNSLVNGYKSSMSQWALSPGRSGSPTMCVDKKDKLPSSFSSLRPQKNNKSVEKILSMGFDLFRTKKSSSSSNSEDLHLLRLLDNRFMQWRFANARAQVVNENLTHTVQSNLTCALDGLTKLRNSVMQKKIQLEREKLRMKLNLVLRSQMKLLESWGAMERQHKAEIAAMKDCLHSVVCKVPLLEGATVDIQSAFIAERQASDLTDSINLMLNSFSLPAYKTAELVSELAEVVAQEKLLLEEFYDLFHAVRLLELRERSLKCSLIQLQ
ncbi:QWRF motif-containing protein 3-like isoform X1 [Arachis stenosperma]|uniref:QWRF motif-containing protein 3-like isoform X1 n=1 Tax=Arachis stenosperma TaxID=217475 RepID=UPI0025AD4819|nr:QWRF motif-containing protein 3-like isoform X1 [Arachis stenosperma]